MVELFQYDPEGPVARASAEPDSRRVKHLRGEVAAEEAPERAVAGGADLALVAAEQAKGGGRWRAVGEYSAALDEHLVGEVRVGDYD